MLLDTTVLVRHLTGEPRSQARRSTAFLREASRLYLADLIVAELVYVLQSVYDRPRDEVAAVIRAVLAYPPVETVDERLLLRATEIYEVYRADFAEAYLAALAERRDGIVVSFDRDLDRVPHIERVEP